MKKITLLVGAILFGIAANAQITLTQSNDPVNVTDGGVACWSSGTGEYRDNSFWRAYDLADFGVTGNFEISEVQWGQGSADASNVLTLNIYIVDDVNLDVALDFDLVASTTHNSSAGDDLSLVTAPLSVVIPAGSIIAFEVNSPDGGTATNVRYFPGINAGGENAPSYLEAADCGIVIPTPAAAIGFPDNQYVMNVIGEEIPLSIGDNLSEYIAVYPTPVVDVLNIKVPSWIQVSGVTLYDILGKNTGATYSNGTVDVSNLSRGVYMLTVNTNEGSLTQRIVKR